MLKPLSPIHNPSPENILKASSPITPSSLVDSNVSVGYKLAFSHSRGKPTNRYSPDVKERKSIYPIANYVSTRRLSGCLRTFIHNVSSVHVPSGVQETLEDPKQTQAMKEEMEAPQKNKTWKLVALPEGKRRLDVNGLSPLNTGQMGQLRDTRQGLGQKGIHKRMA